jgi:hypothetical protein
VAYDTLKEKYIHDTVNHADRECIFAIQARYCWEPSTNSVEHLDRYLGSFAGVITVGVSALREPLRRRLI